MQTDLTLGLTGKVAIVTGAAGDIGRATVELLTANGVRIVAEDIRATVIDLNRPGQIVAIQGDVSEETTARQAVDLTLESFGSVNILVNNAGRTMNKDLIDMSVTDWDSIMAVDARGVKPCG